MASFNASIPLSAFPDNEFDPVKNKMRLAQLLGANQENQIRAMQMSELQRQQAQQANVRSAAQGAVTPAQSSSYQEPTMQLGDMAIPGKSVGVSTPASFDQQKMYQNLLGTDPLAAQDMQGQMAAQKVAQQKQQMEIENHVIQLGAAKRAEAAAQLEQSIKGLYGVSAVPPEQRAAAYQAEIQSQLQQGIIHPEQIGREIPAQYPGDEGMGALLMRADSIGNIIKRVQEQHDAVGLSPEEATALGKKPGERVPLATKNTASEIVNRGNNPEAQSLKAWLAKNPGKDASDYTLWKAKNSPSAIINNSSPLAPDAVDLAAQYYLKTGTLPSGFSRDPGVTKSVINRAAQLSKAGGGDIATNKIDFNTQKALDKDFFGGGKSSQNIRSLNTAIGHLGMLSDAADALQNNDIKALNKVANFFKVQTGSSAPVVFDAIKTAATGELGSTFKGSAATDPEIANISATLNKDLSGKVNKDVIRTDIQLLGSRLSALREQYKQGSGKDAIDKILYPHSRSILGKMGVPVEGDAPQNDPFAQFGGRAH